MRMAYEEFVEARLPGMQGDGLLVGPNFNADLGGLEIEPGDMISALAD